LSGCQLKDALHRVNGENEQHRGEGVSLPHPSPVQDTWPLGAVEQSPGRGRTEQDGDPLKRPDPLGLKCDTITSPRRLVTTSFTSYSTEFR
jgi:hypothetical protein